LLKKVGNFEKELEILKKSWKFKKNWKFKKKVGNFEKCSKF
jgi:hypothetical protein